MEHLYLDVQFHAKVQDVKEVFSILKDLLIEADIRFTPIGMTIRGVDPNKSTTVQTTIFDDSYHFTRSAKIGVYMHTIYKILRGLSSTEEVVFEVHHDRPDTLVIKEKDGSTISLISRNISYEDIMLPDITYHATCSTNGKNMHRAVKEISNFSKLVELQVDGDVGKLNAKIKTSSTTAFFPIASLDTLEEGSTVNFSAFYDTRHIDRFFKHVGNKIVVMRFREGYPLCINMATSNVTMSYYISQVLVEV